MYLINIIVTKVREARGSVQVFVQTRRLASNKRIGFLHASTVAPPAVNHRKLRSERILIKRGKNHAFRGIYENVKLAQNVKLSLEKAK